MNNSRTFEEFITQKIKKTKQVKRRIFTVSFLGCLLPGIFIILSLTLNPEEVGAIEKDFELVRGISSFIIIPFVLPLLISSITLITRRNIKKWPLYKRAITNNKDVIWAYFGLTNVKVLHLFTIKKHEIYIVDNKKKWSIFQITREETEEFAPKLQDCFPMATIGWSEENFTKYKKDHKTLMTQKTISNNINEVHRRA